MRRKKSWNKNKNETAFLSFEFRDWVVIQDRDSLWNDADDARDVNETNLSL